MKKMIVMRRICLVTVLAASMILTTACGRSSSSSKLNDAKESYASEGAYAMAEEAMDYDGLYDEYEEMEVPATGAETSEQVQAEQVKDNGRKLIRTYSMSAETLEFQKLISDIEAKVNALGGYIENSDIGINSYKKNTHYASFTIRIPKDQAPSFVQHISEAANVTDKTENVEDVTLAYVDLNSHKIALQTEYDRLIVLLDQAESVEDIITIEQRLSDVRYQIESMESQLRTYDNKIDYSTIYLSVKEVEQITEPEKVTFLGRLSEGLSENFSDVGNGIVDFVVWFITAIPYWIVLAFWVVVIIVIVKICKKSFAKRKQKAWEKHQQMMAAQAKATTTATAATSAPVKPVSPAVPETTGVKAETEEKKED